jgi:translocation and assembly module TamB
LAPFLGAFELWATSGASGEVSGRIDISGDLDTPELISASARLAKLVLKAGDYGFGSQGPVVLDYANQTLTLSPANFVGPETQLQLGGYFKGQDSSIRLNAKGDMNLVLLNPLLKKGATAGQLGIEVLVTGPVSQPRVLGQAELSEVFLRHPDVPTTVFDANGKLRFTTDQVSIDELSASTSLGEVGATGGIFLEGLRPVRWLVNIFGADLRLEYPEEVFSVLDVDVDLTRSEAGQLLSGVVYVRSAEYREEISLPELILRYGSSQATPVAATGPDTVLDIDVEGYQTFRIDNNLADLVASGDFRVRGSLSNPIILGSSRIESGQLFLENNDYDIVRGNITFNDPRRTRPVFSFEAQTEVRDYSVDVLLHGPLDKLNFSFRADPPLPTASIVTLLALGQTQEELGAGRGRSGDQTGSLALLGAGAILTRGLGGQLQQQSSRLFGLERFSIDPFLQGSERNPAAQVTLGKQLTDTVSVTYSTVLGGEDQGQVLVVQMKLTDWLSVVGSGDQTGAVALDFKLKKRF